MRGVLPRLIAGIAILLLWAEPLAWLAAAAHRPLPMPVQSALIEPDTPPRGISTTLPWRRDKQETAEASSLSPMRWLASIRRLATAPPIRSEPASDVALAPVLPVMGISVPGGGVTVRAAKPPLAWKAVRGTEGYWRLGMTEDGVWWFISPEDKPEFLNMVTTVQPYQLSHDASGAQYISRDLQGTPDAPGDLNAWARQTMQRVLDSGFKGLGAWSHRAFHDLPIAMSHDLNVWASAPREAPRLYHPGWLPAAEATIARQVQPLRENRYLVGYYLDNELDFNDGTIGPGVYFDGLPAQDPNRQELLKVARELWPNVTDFNAAWNTRVKEWAEVEAWKGLPREPVEAYNRLRSHWLEHLMGDYFRQTTQLIRKYDPNHLILGIRFAGTAPAEVVRASRSRTDAQSLNYYVADAKLDPELFALLHEASGQPVVISEYSFHSLDGRSGNRNTAGFLAQVIDQQARAEGYRLLTTRLARVPYVVGADWFQWSDEPPAGRSADGEDVDFGVVDVDDRPYETLVEAIRDTSPRLNQLHQQSAISPGEEEPREELWREAFVRPNASIPYLLLPPRLDGELSDWPASARLQNLTRAQVVGLPAGDWSKPTVYIGWRPEGVYLGLSVPNSHIQVAPMTGRWWTRDAVEFWFATRPVHTLEYAYNEYCHQFFFLPTDPASNGGGGAGIVGQWHRPGDALKDHLVPHPEVRATCRILGDHYTAEIFIPRQALHGFEPEQRPHIAFNIATRNYAETMSWHWSAGKEIRTQSRPSTWGDLRLLPP